MRRLLFLLILLGTFCGINYDSVNAQVIRTVALTGQQAPGLPEGIVFAPPGPNDFFAFAPFGPSINSLGQTAFQAPLSGPGIDDSNSESIWSEGSGTLKLVARDGDPAPGFPAGVTFGPDTGVPGERGSFGTIVNINSAGQTLFDAKIAGPGIDFENDDVLWSEGSGTLAALAIERMHPPGGPAGSEFGYGPSFPFSPLTVLFNLLNARGDTSFIAIYSGVPGLTDFEAGLWTSATGSLEGLALTSQQIPNEAPGTNLAFFAGGLALNSNGHTVFSGSRAGPGINETNAGAIWSNVTGTLTAVIRDGDAAPAFPIGVVVEGLGRSETQLNSNSHIAFEAELHGTGITASSDSAIWEGIPGNFRLVSQEGNHAPGLPNNAILGRVSSVLLNDRDDVAFSQEVLDENVICSSCFGIWSEGLGGLHLVARGGEQAPDLPMGVVFLQDSFFGGVGSFSFNSLGQVAMFGLVSGPGIDDTNDTGIWAEDLNGQLKLIVREGDELEVFPDDFRTITQIVSLLGESTGTGHANSFNDRGQIAFRAKFTDGSEGIFVSNLVAIPEPSSVAILVCWMICGCSPRTRWP